LNDLALKNTGGAAHLDCLPTQQDFALSNRYL